MEKYGKVVLCRYKALSVSLPRLLSPHCSISTCGPVFTTLFHYSQGKKSILSHMIKPSWTEGQEKQPFAWEDRWQLNLASSTTKEKRKQIWYICGVTRKICYSGDMCLSSCSRSSIVSTLRLNLRVQGSFCPLTSKFFSSPQTSFLFSNPWYYYYCDGSQGEGQTGSGRLLS